MKAASPLRGRRSRAAAGLLFVVGVLVMGMGAYFMVLRPAFLPEDNRFIGVDAATLTTAAPGIMSWLRFVFAVLGAYAFTTGLFMTHIAFAAYRSGLRTPVLLVAIAGLTSLGVMVAVNFAIQSDFRWELAGLAALCALSVLLDLPIWPMPGTGPRR